MTEQEIKALAGKFLEQKSKIEETRTKTARLQALEMDQTDELIRIKNQLGEFVGKNRTRVIIRPDVDATKKDIVIIEHVTGGKPDVTLARLI